MAKDMSRMLAGSTSLQGRIAGLTADETLQTITRKSIANAFIKDFIATGLHDQMIAADTQRILVLEKLKSWPEEKKSALRVCHLAIGKKDHWTRVSAVVQALGFPELATFLGKDHEITQLALIEELKP